VLTSNKTTAPKTKKPRAPKAKTVPTREEIALRAYHIYLERQGAPGHPLEDWTRAERELLENAVAKPRRKAPPKSKAA
jgi:hypothetical protein